VWARNRGLEPCRRRTLYDLAHVPGDFPRIFTDSTRLGPQLLLWRRHSRHTPGGAAPTSINGSSERMSSLIFDYLLPILGPDAASYWAQMLMINPQ
jgi:hypothetical protein